MAIRFLFWLKLAAALTALMISPFPVHAQSRQQNAEELVRDATKTLTYFANTREFSGLWDTAADARAMVIIPASYRAGFLFGGSGGNGVMVARNKDGSWSGPTFLSVGSVSFGLQAGGEVSEIVLLAMTDRGKEGLLASSVKLGGDVTIAAGPVGIGAKAQTVDILAFARTRGLYGGLSLEGSILDTKKRWNRAYYGADVSAVDVVYRGVEDNPVSIPLRQAALELSSRARGSSPDVQSVTNEPNRPALADPTKVTPPTGRVYTAPGQAAPSSDPQRIPNQLPVLDGAPDQAPIYEDDPAYGGAPLRRPN